MAAPEMARSWKKHFTDATCAADKAEAAKSPELVTARGVRRSIRFPIADWASCEVLVPKGEPVHFVDHASGAMDFRRVSPNPSFVRGQPNVPLTTARKVGRAMEVTQRGSRALGAVDKLGTPEVVSDNEDKLATRLL